MKTELTIREREVAELLAWGAAKKEVADHLFISERTVENHTRNIYEKTGCSKVNELSAWWFCNRFNISIQLSPLVKTIISVAFIGSCLLALINPDSEEFRIPTRTARTMRITRTARRKQENNTFILAS